MNNIIFLDIDGVLNDCRCLFKLDSVKVIKRLIQENHAKVVIISSWQMNGTSERRKKVQQMLDEIGISNVDFIDPNYEGSFLDIEIPPRVLGIIDYLKKVKSSNYVILDDDYSNDYRLFQLNHYRTNPFKGITSKGYDKIHFKEANTSNFKGVTYQYRKFGKYEQITNDLVKVLKMKYENDKSKTI